MIGPLTGRGHQRAGKTRAVALLLHRGDQRLAERGRVGDGERRCRRRASVESTGQREAAPKAPDHRVAKSISRHVMPPSSLGCRRG